MRLDEIEFNSASKDIRIDQKDFRDRKQHYLRNKLPFTIDVVRKDGQPVSLVVSVSRIDTETTVNLLTDDALVGCLHLAKPDLFPGAFYVASMAVLPEYQGNGIGPLLYDALIKRLGLSLVGYDQSLGAMKLWSRLSKMPGNAMYAVMPNKQHGNAFFKAAAKGDATYVYVNYDGTTMPILNDSRLFVIMTRRGGKMDTYVKQHMKLVRMRLELSRARSRADPFSDHLVPAEQG